VHILFTRFPLESRFGGAEVQTLSLMKGLSERGYEVSFLGSCATLLEKTRELKIKNQELQIGTPPVTKWGAISFLWRKRIMQKDLIHKIESSGKWDAVFMLSLTEKLLLTKWCADQGIKVIWVEHDRIGRWLTKNPWLLRLRTLSKSATTVVVSALSIDLYRSLGWKGKIVAIPNGIDLARLAERAASSEQRADGVFRIGCIARLTRDKGVDVLINAVKDLPNIHLTIIGSGREESNIRSLLKKNLQPAAYDLKVSHPDITAFYRSIDLLVLPSREHDPFGLVVAEAMAAEVPIICTDVCGIAAYLSSEDGIVVRSGKTEDVRAAIVRMQDPVLRTQYAEHGKNTAREKFSAENMVDEYARFL